MAWSSLVCVWLQVRAVPRPIVTLDQMASINTFNQSRVSAQRCSQTQTGSPARPYSNHRPAVTFPPNVAINQRHEGDVLKHLHIFPSGPPHPPVNPEGC